MTFLIWLSLWLPVLVWAAVIFYLSAIPGLQSGLGAWDLILRKGAHITEYAILTALLLRAVRRTWPEITETTLIAASTVAAALYAVSDEVHQAFVPRRGPSLFDVMIDGMGIVLCLCLYKRWRHSKGAGCFT